MSTVVDVDLSRYFDTIQHSTLLGKIAKRIRILRSWVRTLLTRRKKRSVGWRRWSNEYLYGVLGLYWDWKMRPLSGAEEFA